jgi:hypothetical protein
MILHPAVIVHGIDHARAALRPGFPVTLVSSRGAALFAGCLWWRALIDLARAEFPGVDLADVLDCADQAGRAMAALRAGQRVLVLDPGCPGHPAVVSCAATCGAAVLEGPPPALDLGTLALGTARADRRLAGWLWRDSRPGHECPGHE